jgi:predicted CXXCH cytochrome family protein
LTRRLFALLLLAAAALLGCAGAAAATTPTLTSALPSPDANPVAAADNQACLQCHSLAAKPILVQVNGRRTRAVVNGAVYEHSRHGKLACTSCHLGFKADAHSAAETQNWLRTAKLTACANCHADQFAMYRGSFHGGLVMKQGSTKAPMCADCHSPHNILAPQSAAFRASIPGLCARCHSSQAKTYLDSYHGKATYLGDAKTAVCTDCHGGHRILPASNPQSLVSKHHLVHTCSQCHPGANANFASFMVHVNPNDPRSSWYVFAINIAYWLLIATVFSFGIVHSGLYIYRGFKDGLYARSHS